MSDIYIVDQVGVDDRLKRIIKMATLRTWRKFKLPYPETFWLTVLEEDPEDSTCGGYYTPAADMITLFTKWMIKGTKFDTDVMTALFTAHELTHRAQNIRGTVPPPTHRNWCYEQCPYEREANQIGVDIAGELFPNFASIEIGDKTVYPTDQKVIKPAKVDIYLPGTVIGEVPSAATYYTFESS